MFYEDEVDIHLNPKIGADWQLRGQQKRVVTPGQNEKHYLAGVLHSGTEKVSYVSGSSKSSLLFISLLKHLKAAYRRAKTVTLIVDNCIIHKSRETLHWLEQNPKFRLIYQPVYSPWVNHVERLWHQAPLRHYSPVCGDRDHKHLIAPPFQGYVSNQVATNIYEDQMENIYICALSGCFNICVLSC